MKNIIRINKASFYGYHGVFRSEQNIGGKFEADIEMVTNFEEAAKTDNLKKTIDYEQVYNLINTFGTSKKFYLIESLALRLAEELLLRFESISEVRVKVRKNNPPIGGVVDSVEVEVHRRRDEINSSVSL